MVGTSGGSLFQLTVTPNNSILLNNEMRFKVSQGEAVTSVGADPEAGTVMIGTSHSSVMLLSLSHSQPAKLVRTNASVHH